MPLSPPADELAHWHPVAGSFDVAPRHVFHGQLLGQELAVWRADDGYVNVWLNRCPHRGVRLSVGINDGMELHCQYHAWRYANRTGGCTYVPAHPGDAPAMALCARTFQSAERYGLVWSTIDGTGQPPDVDALDVGESLALRGVPFDVAAETVVDALLASAPGATAQGPLAISAATDDGVLVFFVQPVDGEHCVVRGVLAEAPSADARLAVLRRHDVWLCALRESVEQSSVGTHSTNAAVPLTAQRAPAPPTSSIAVVVRRKWVVAEGIAAFELAPAAGVLPTAQPGSHIDVHLANGHVRQYSLVNGPGELDAYRIGVKLEPDSRGGSSHLHGAVEVGDALTVSAPHHNFPLRRDGMRTVLLAGGIGITPLLSMARALHVSGPAFEFHVFAESRSHVAFKDVLAGLGDAVSFHLGHDPAATADEVRRILGPFAPGSQLYVCGPGPMLDAARRIAADLGWPDDSVHFEYFKNTREVDDSSAFEIVLARSGATLEVPSGRTILSVLREHGIDVDSSCEQGACGTCLVGVLEGEPDHQDVYLRESEHAAGDRMTVCISRAKSKQLVLDL